MVFKCIGFTPVSCSKYAVNIKASVFVGGFIILKDFVCFPHFASIIAVLDDGLPDLTFISDIFVLYIVIALQKFLMFIVFPVFVSSFDVVLDVFREPLAQPGAYFLKAYMFVRCFENDSVGRRFVNEGNHLSEVG